MKVREMKLMFCGNFLTRENIRERQREREREREREKVKKRDKIAELGNGKWIHMKKLRQK